MAVLERGDVIHHTIFVFGQAAFIPSWQARNRQIYMAKKFAEAFDYISVLIIQSRISRCKCLAGH